MRIIDKNTDFYDYLQNVYRDNTLTFDRQDSYVLTKDMIGWKLNRYSGKHNFLLLQVCNSFWLFLLETTDTDNYNTPVDFTVTLLGYWKNYHKTRVQYQLQIIEFRFNVYHLWQKDRSFDFSTKKIIKNSNALIDAINHNDYKTDWRFNHHEITIGEPWKKQKVEKHIPLLKASGLSQYINPIEIYLALEEYFSAEKTAGERTESVNLTDKEKIENHGFDLKTSFRNV